MEKPLAYDLCCGLGGWTEGLLSEGYRCIGYDIEAHEYGDEKYPGELRLKSILDLHGSELADADLIVASPPCQFFSYTAMPWSLAKERAARTRADPALLAKELALFNACFRIQREACEAAGRHIPMVVENVKGAQPWVGRAAWNFGSYYLWGDVPALMPRPHLAVKVPGMNWSGSELPGYKAVAFNDIRHQEGSKNSGGSWFAIGSPGQKETDRNPVHALTVEGTKAPARGWFNDGSDPDRMAMKSSKSPARKAASARIAKIPFALSSHIARVYRPRLVAA